MADFEDAELKRAIALSLGRQEPIVASSSRQTIQDQLRERRERMLAAEGPRTTVKRAREDDPSSSTMPSAKLAKVDSNQPVYLDHGEPSSSRYQTMSPSALLPSRGPIKTVDHVRGLGFSFPNGALRITRTPNRSTAPNTVSLPELLNTKHLKTACIYSYFIGGRELYDLLPRGTDANPIFVGQDMNNDPMSHQFREQVGIEVARDYKARGKIFKLQTKFSREEVSRIAPLAAAAFLRQDGFKMFYPYAGGCSHSKFLVLVFDSYIRVVITSCNLMDIDIVHGDNHWFIQDLPKLDKPIPSKRRTSFELDLWDHLESLNCPAAFVDPLRGQYDFSAVKVSLVSSKPGSFSADLADKHGLLRLRAAVKELGLEKGLYHKDRKMLLEVCCASLGNLNPAWLDLFFDCAVGRKKLEVADTNCDVPNIKVTYPTRADVESASTIAQDGASNMGCHVLPWDKAPQDIKQLFYHYTSKAHGNLTHQKLVVAIDENQDDDMPQYIYIGSANYSKSAWGNVKISGSVYTMKEINNFELGVIIPGTLIPSLIQPDSDWRDVVYTFNRPAVAYDLRKKEKPFNDARWVNH